jgi:hypothetical protein
VSEPHFTISLRIWHPTYTSESIIEAIGLRTRFAHSVGRPRVTPTGASLEGIYGETYCTFRLKEKIDGYFVDGIRDLTPVLEKFRIYFKEIRDSGGRAEVYIGVFVEGMSGFTLEANDMLRLTNMSLDLSVEYYF